MRVIDLLVELNNFNNGKTAKLPRKIKLYGNIYKLKKDGIDNHYYYDGNLYTLIKDLDDTCDLNHEIEVIEEDKKIEKLNIINGAVDGKWKTGKSYNYTLSALDTIIINKINEVIYKLNKMDENK